MTKMEKPTAFSRRAVMKGGGALGVSLGMPSIGVPDALPSLDTPACSAH